jgi:hypothetical protein
MSANGIKFKSEFKIWKWKTENKNRNRKVAYQTYLAVQLWSYPTPAQKEAQHHPK